jgi:hypothetical protein
MGPLRLLAAARCAALARSALLFGCYGDNLTATPYATIHQADTPADAEAAFAAFKVPSLLSVYSAVFQGAPGRLVLQPQWQAQLAALAASAAPLLQSGALLGFNLGDELVWNCLAPANLSLVASAVRGHCPRGACTLWYNEAAVFGGGGAFKDSCGNEVTDWAIPSALDLFSTDIYHMDGLVEGWVAKWVKTFYDAWIFPHLTPLQKVVLVPGSFGSNVNHYPNGTYVCDKACYDAMCAHDAADFAAWAAQDARVAGVFPWNWGGCPTCNGSQWTPPHTCCKDELGTKEMPQTAAAWKALFGPRALAAPAA